ncbi:MAG: carotenoid 1,2-hydratase [Pseudomonadota bacterium]
MSDDGARAVSVIGFIGSVFSPWYRWSGRRRPENHCCINVATYGKGGRWTMTDRGAQALRLSPDKLEVGPSSMRWTGSELVIDVNETCTPHLHQLRGQIRLIPEGMTDIEVALHPDGSHVWRPFAPTARIEVDLDRTGWKWSGHGYFDSNFGTRALEADFSYWTWARLPRSGGTTAFYDAERRDGSTLELGLQFSADGAVERIPMPPKARMARGLWTVYRETRADQGYRPRQVKAMLDAPFYSRSAIRTQIDGEETIGVHEALDLNRFASPLLKPMLAVRVPRRANWSFPD